MGGEADLHEWITTVINCSSNKKRSREGFKWEVMPSGGKLVSAFTQVLHLKGNCGILNTQALYSHVLVCKWITLSKTFGISPVDILSWQPRHVCCGCSAVLLGHSECFQTDPYREIFFFFFFWKRIWSFFGARNSLTQGEVLLWNLTRAELLQEDDGESVGGTATKTVLSKDHTAAVSHLPAQSTHWNDSKTFNN